MFKDGNTTERGEQTKERILEEALRLFRRKGFESTTMRAIADAAEVAPGAAYYYYPSKEALVLAYYERVQTAHETQVRGLDTQALRERVQRTFRGKLELVQHDRALLGALFRFVGEPEHPLSPLGPHTRGLREQAVRTFRLAVHTEDVAAELREVLPTLLWALHLGVLLYFLYDRSPSQQRTFWLVDRAADLVCVAIGLSALPGAAALSAPLWALLREAELLPSPGDPPLANANPVKKPRKKSRKRAER